MSNLWNCEKDDDKNDNNDEYWWGIADKDDGGNDRRQRKHPLSNVNRHVRVHDVKVFGEAVDDSTYLWIKCVSYEQLNDILLFRKKNNWRHFIFRWTLGVFYISNQTKDRFKFCSAEILKYIM